MQNLELFFGQRFSWVNEFCIHDKNNVIYSDFYMFYKNIQTTANCELYF